MSPRRPIAAFTLVELLIGMTLSLTVMTAVLSAYTFMGRSLARITNQETLETASRRTLLYFAQDVRMANGISGTPSASSVTLTLPTANSTRNITYHYNSGGSATTVSGYSIPANSLARIDVSASTGLTLHRNLLSCSFTYYDSSGNPYTSYTNYMTGLKQVMLSFTSQTGVSSTGTLTPVNTVASPRLLLRNKAWLQ
jgi:Tfp pilus assembly protein PilW